MLDGSTARTVVRAGFRARAARLLSTFGRRPGLIVAAGFAALIAIGTFLLMLPVATASGEGTPVVEALFTATSAVCITGLAVCTSAAMSTWPKVDWGSCRWHPCWAC